MEGNKILMPQNINERIKITRPVVSEYTATANKLRQLELRLLGIKTTNFEVLSNEYVYIPHRLYRYEFKVNRKTLLNRSGKYDKMGELFVIFDNNEAHPFESDMEEIGTLDFIDIDLSDKKGEILEAQYQKEKAREKVEAFIQNKILRRLYASSGDIKLLDDKPFFRPAKSLSIRYKSNPDSVYERSAYLDSYGVVNEHILGLKVRVGGGV